MGHRAHAQGQDHSRSIEPGKIGVGLFGGTGFDLVTGENIGAFLGVPVTLQLSSTSTSMPAGSGTGRPTSTSPPGGAGFEWNFVKPLTLIGEVFGVSGPGQRNPCLPAGLRYTPVEQVDFDLIYGRNITGENAKWITLGVNVRFVPAGK